MANPSPPQPRPSEDSNPAYLAGTRGCPDRQLSLLGPYYEGGFLHFDELLLGVGVDLAWRRGDLIDQ